VRVELLQPPDVRCADVLVGVAAQRQAQYEARPGARAPSPDDLLVLIDRVIAFARTGVQALTPGD